MGVMKEMAQGYLPTIQEAQPAPVQGNPEMSESHPNTVNINGVRVPNDDPHPMVVIIKEATTAQAYEAGKLLGQCGLHGRFIGGQLAQQLAAIHIDQFCNPPKEEKKRRRKKK